MYVLLQIKDTLRPAILVRMSFLKVKHVLAIQDSEHLRPLLLGESFIRSSTLYPLLTGTLSRTEHSVTVQYPRGEYTFHVLDHVRVHVSSMPSHAHGMSLSLRLLRCGPAPLDPSAQGEGEKRMANKEMIKVS